MMSAEGRMLFRARGTITMFPALFHTMSETFATRVIRPLLTLVKGEERYHAQGEHPIEPAFVAIDEQGSQDEVVDKEEEQVDRNMAPDDEYLLSVE